MAATPWTRRDFLRNTTGAAAAAAGTAVAGSTLEALAGPAPRSRVVLVRDAAAVDAEGKVSAAVVQRMLDDAVAALAGVKDPVAAWKTFVKPADTVGIKTNEWQYLPTPPEIEQAIRQRVLDAGVPAERVAIDDRGVLRNPVFKSATAFINTRPMRAHHWAGVGSLIKNYITFAEDRPAWHPDACADLGGIWKLPHVEGRTRLNVLVMLTPLAHNKGPHDFKREFVWPYAGLLVGSDPVAVDTMGLRIVEARRRIIFGKDLPLEVPPKHIRVAADKYKLGVADPARIELVRLGLAEGVLI